MEIVTGWSERHGTARDGIDARCPFICPLTHNRLTRRKTKLMLREGVRPVATPKRKPIEPPSQEDVMWGVYMSEVRNTAQGDSFEPDSVNELIDGMHDYQEVVTHPVTTFAKDRDYQHGAIPRVPKTLSWVNRTMPKWH